MSSAAESSTVIQSSSDNAAAGTGTAASGGGGGGDAGDKLYLPKSCVKRIMKLNGRRLFHVDISYVIKFVPRTCIHSSSHICYIYLYLYLYLYLSVYLS